MGSQSQFSHPDGWYAAVGDMRYRGRDWVVTPSYSSVPKLELPVNPYEDTQIHGVQNLWLGWTRTDKATGNVSQISGPGYSYYFQNLREFSADALTRLGHDTVVAGLVNETVLKALVKTGDIKSNVLVSLKEASKTSDLILDRANKLFRAYKSFRRGHFRDVAKHLGLSPSTVHNTWLEYKYGWTPLLMEVKGSAEFLSQQVEGRLNNLPIRASEKRSLQDLRVVTGFLDGAAWDLHEEIHADIEVRVKLWIDLTNQTTSALQQLGITNPLLYAWEIIPFSFVFDWFVSVGDYLAGLSALNGITVRKAMVQVLSATQYKYVYPESFKDNGTYITRLYPRVGTYDRRNYSRQPYIVDPLSLYPPVNTSGLSWQRLVSGLALLRGSARGLERGIRV